jgi:poly(3-hydroxybutyrate) depolymerase
MRRKTWVLGFGVAWAALLRAEAAGPAAEKELRAALDAYFDARWGDEAREIKKVTALIEKRSLSLEVVERLLRAGRLAPTAVSRPKGEILRELPLSCDHVDYDTVFHLYLPRSLDPQQPAPLVLIGHGGNGAMRRDNAVHTAPEGLKTWIGEAERSGVILAAPAAERGWGWIGDSIVLSLVSKLQRERRIDPNRIYLTGHSMGGHLAWRSGVFLPDRWAALSPMSGGCNYVANKQVFNLFNLPGYATYGTNEPYQINTFNNRIKEWRRSTVSPGSCARSAAATRSSPTRSPRPASPSASTVAISIAARFTPAGSDGCATTAPSREILPGTTAAPGGPDA